MALSLVGSLFVRARCCARVTLVRGAAGPGRICAAALPTQGQRMGHGSGAPELGLYHAKEPGTGNLCARGASGARRERGSDRGCHSRPAAVLLMSPLHGEHARGAAGGRAGKKNWMLPLQIQKSGVRRRRRRRRRRFQPCSLLKNYSEDAWIVWKTIQADRFPRGC